MTDCTPLWYQSYNRPKTAQSWGSCLNTVSLCCWNTHELAARRPSKEWELPAPAYKVIAHTPETIHLHFSDHRQCAQHMQRVCTIIE